MAKDQDYKRMALEALQIARKTFEVLVHKEAVEAAGELLRLEAEYAKLSSEGDTASTVVPPKTATEKPVATKIVTLPPPPPPPPEDDDQVPF